MYGTGRLLEYDVLVKPGARLDAFRLRLDGDASVSINGNGEAEIAVGGRTLVQRAPVLYQDIDGARRRVRGSYVLSTRARSASAPGPTILNIRSSSIRS